MTLLLAISSLVSRLLGIFRNNRLADAFGASVQSDAYFAAFQIPDLVYSLLIFGALSAAFVPLFIDLYKKDTDEAMRFASSLLNLLLMVMGVCCLLIFLFAGPIVELLYATHNAELRDLTTELLRVLILAPLFFAGSGIWGGIQTASGRFWGYALAPVVYNLSIIFGIVWLSPMYGIHGVAYGVVAGAFLHAFVQLIACAPLGFRWRAVLSFDRHLRELLRLGLPRILSLASYQVNLLVEAVIAGIVMTGGLTVLRYAQDLQSFPLGIVGLAVATASFSRLSHLAIQGDYDSTARYLRQKISQILVFVLPSAVGLIVLREQLIHVVFATGAFDSNAVLATETTLAWAAPGLLGMSLLPLVSRAYFAHRDTWIPFSTGLVTLALNALLAYQLALRFGVQGLTMSYSLLVSLQILVLLMVLKRRYLGCRAVVDRKDSFIFLLASLMMGGAVSLLEGWLNWQAGWALYLLLTLGLIAFACALYFTLLYVFFGRKMFRFLRKDLPPEAVDLRV